MSYIRDAAESTIRRLLVQFDEAHMLVVERFVVEQCLAQQDDSGSFAVGPCGDSDNSVPGAGPNQAGADGNGAAGQTFSPVPSGLSPEHSHTDGTGTFSGGDSTADPTGNGAASGPFAPDRFTVAEYTAAPGFVVDHAIRHGQAVVVRPDGSTRVVISVPRAERVEAGLAELRDAPAVKAAPMGVMLEWDMPGDIE